MTHEKIGSMRQRAAKQQSKGVVLGKVDANEHIEWLLYF